MKALTFSIVRNATNPFKIDREEPKFTIVNYFANSGIFAFLY